MAGIQDEQPWISTLVTKDIPTGDQRGVLEGDESGAHIRAAMFTEQMKTETPSVLQEAQQIIHGPRRDSYGHPKVNFQRIADLWKPILGIDITPEQVALCLVQLKVARLINKVDRDGMVDVAGYIGCLAMIVDEDEA